MGRWERIFLNQQMLIIQRRGHVITEVPPKAVLVDVETPDISSTSVRQLARLGRGFDQWVTPSVAKLIQREGLYNYAANTEVLRANA
jgi:nicotinic acid mononucleotide adenylyltransferase